MFIDSRLVIEGIGAEKQDEITIVKETEISHRQMMMGGTLGAHTPDRNKNGEPAGTEM